MSAGVNVTPCDEVPTRGVIEESVQAKDPGTLAVPPLRIEEAKDCPWVMLDAVGAPLMVGVALATVSAWVTSPAGK